MLTVAYTNNGSAGGLLSLYMDGILFETLNTVDIYPYYWDSLTNVYIGGNMVQQNHYFYNGKIDNIRTYNRALTAAEVQALFNAKQ